MKALSVVDIEPYCLLRASLALFQKTPHALNPEELTQATRQAKNEYELENRVLRSAEAAAVIITEEALADAIAQISSRFEDQKSFIEELALNNLDLQALQSALLRQCKVENVLERVASRASEISEVEIGIYYHMHPEQFKQPEQRAARHILITINDEFSENSRENALQRINAIADKLSRKPHKFADLAAKNSECPTALQGGELGVFPRGKLYPEIDEELFKLKENQISSVIETEAGFHIVKCEKIHHTETISLKKAQPKILKFMQDRSRRTCQRSWLASLPTASESVPEKN